jgi:SAM-dependent methyltransferase
MSQNPLSAVEPWDLVAEGYAAEGHAVMDAFSQRAIELAAPSRDARVLDVAAGSGATTLLVAPRVAEVHALDFSEKMLEALRRRAREHGLTNVHAQKGDGQALPYEDTSFDAGFSMFGIMFFPDRARGFSELRRVLRPGAPAVVSTWAPVDQSPLMKLMFAALSAADPGRAPPPRDLLALDTPERLADALRTAGFAAVDVVAHEHFLEVGSATHFWNALTRSNAPLVMLRKRIGEEAWAVQAERARAHLEEEIRGPTRLGTMALLGIGRAR